MTVPSEEELVLESRHKGNSAPSVRSPSVDEERMRPGHWLGLVLCVPSVLSH